MRALILAGLLFAGPALADTTPPAGPPAGPTDGKTGRAPPQSVWKIGAGGDAEHLQSGLSCPLEVGGFRQAGITTYDGYGLDVSCGYNSRSAAITLYLSRGFDLEEGYVSAKSALMKNAEARQPVLKTEDSVHQGGIAWRRALYELDGGGFRSDIWMADVGGWVLKYRATYPARDAAAVAAELERLTALVRGSAGARLDLCAKSPVPERPGKPAKGGRGGSDDMMSAILGGAAAVAAEDKDEAPVPITFCPEAPLPQKDMNLLTWHGVTPDGEDANVDRVTGMTVGPPPTLDIARDDAASLVLGELGRKSGPRWTATITQGTNTMIFGHFDGRPATKLTAELMVRILSGKARSLGGYDAGSKTITVTTPK
jgi:hypothetical protein